MSKLTHNPRVFEARCGFLTPNTGLKRSDVLFDGLPGFPKSFLSKRTNNKYPPSNPSNLSNV